MAQGLEIDRPFGTAWQWESSEELVACTGTMKRKWLGMRCKRLSVGELQEKKSLGKLGIRWKCNIKVDHKNRGVNQIEWGKKMNKWRSGVL